MVATSSGDTRALPDNAWAVLDDAFRTDSSTWSASTAHLWDSTSPLKRSGMTASALTHGGGMPELYAGLRAEQLAALENWSAAIDTDGDRVADSEDNCRGVTSAGRADLDGDGQGDVCDADIDGDGAAPGPAGARWPATSRAG